MSSLVTLGGYTPPRRYPPDDTLWTQYRLEEAAESSGPWSVIEGPTNLDPAVTDPAEPPTYSFTTDQAEIGPGGWYRIVWIDATGFEQTTPPARYLPWRPAVRDVASLIRARTKDAHDNELGTFTEATRPTADECEAIIDGVLPIIEARLGRDIAEPFWPAARRLAALRAAMGVERTYWPESVNSEGSSYQALKDEYDEALEALLAADLTPSVIGGRRAQSIPVGSGLVLSADDLEALNQ